MGATFSNISSEEMRNYVRDTGLSPQKIQLLKSRFDALDREAKGYLSRADLLAIPELVLNPVGDRIIDMFFQTQQQLDHSISERVTFGQFIRTVTTFRPCPKNAPLMNSNEPNSRRNKLAFAFRMYDLNGDGSISRDEILAVLHMMVGDEVTDEQLQSIAQRAILEVDEDADGELSFEEYVKIMERVDVEQKLSIKFLD